MGVDGAQRPCPGDRRLPDVRTGHNVDPEITTQGEETQSREKQSR